jgi:hypothetical protein
MAFGIVISAVLMAKERATAAGMFNDWLCCGIAAKKGAAARKGVVTSAAPVRMVSRYNIII